LLIGGFLWGIIGDKYGRRKIMFGAIMLYSVANIANAFVTDIPQYIVVRFFAGLGLAGELGGAVTLVSEIFSKEKRGYATMIIVTMGACGAIVAALIGRTSFHIFSPFWCLIVSCRMSVLKISFSFRIMSGLMLPAFIR